MRYWIRYHLLNRDWLNVAYEFAEIYQCEMKVIFYKRGWINRNLMIEVTGPTEDLDQRFHKMFGHLLRHHNAKHQSIEV